MAAAAILDIDGTLVDSNYQHALAWFRAFRNHDVVLPVWRIHRQIGKGGDHMVRDLAGDQAEEDKGDDIRAAEKILYAEMIHEVQPLEQARDLICDLKEHGRTVVLASSAKAEEVDHYLDLLDAREIADAWTTSADVDATKPDPDLVIAAMERVGTRDAVMVGDTPGTAKPPRPPGSRRSPCLPGASPRTSCARPARSPCSSRSSTCGRTWPRPRSAVRAAQSRVAPFKQAQTTERGVLMSILDKITGRAKKAAGDLANDPSLRREGRLEERKGEAKDELADAHERADAKAEEVASLERQT